jgi:hypothetical protein
MCPTAAADILVHVTWVKSRELALIRVLVFTHQNDELFSFTVLRRDMRILYKGGPHHSGLHKYVTSIDSCLNGLKYLNGLLLEGLLQSSDCQEQERHVGRVVPAAVTPTSATVSCRSPSRYKRQFQLYLNHNHNHNHNHKIPKSILPLVSPMILRHLVCQGLT